ncbi:hypothetical protein RJ639_040165 [Escallonia herrerae]|uniref:Copper amine oxidase N3-terminal domain-containing protein n=1 Tax=Escallonia herrerae TaxID=1293975 RepID=A0AA88WEK0_9ASTE|nr:hypothetical protein RJ639_040165 [Escallonia herrerae]
MTISDKIYEGAGYPMLTFEKQITAGKLPFMYPPFVASISKRGLKLEEVMCGSFTVGWFGKKKVRAQRIIRVIVTEENVVVERGLDPLPPVGGKKDGRGQSKSRDAIASLDGRTCVLQVAMGDTKDRLGFVEQNLQTLEDHVLKELESLKKTVTGQDELST